MALNRVRSAVALVLASVVALGFVAGRPVRAQSADQEKRITILYTTDIHAHYLPQKDEKSGKLHGGLAALSATVADIRSQAKIPIFLFDSGDVSTGHPISDLEQQGVLGGALFRMMNAIGYDAWCIGNHDFDHGRENASKIIELLKFPTLSANLHAEGDPPLKVERWKILEKGGVKVGVFGLMTEGLLNVTVRDRVKGISVSPAVAAAREAVAALQSNCDVIVGLSHSGSDEDVAIADQVPGIDVMLSGHNHKPLKARKHGNTIVTEGEIWSRKLGRLDLTIKNQHVADFSQEFMPLDGSTPATPGVQVVLDEVREAIGKKLDEVLGKLETPWKREYHAESNIGDFFAEGMRVRTKTDVAFLNSGGIRTNLGSGDIKLGDVDEIFPFDNEVVTFEATGADLMVLFQQNAHASVNQSYGILQMAGARYEYSRKGKSSVSITKASVGGEPLDPKKTYKVSTIDFIARDQHEKYFGKDCNVAKLTPLGLLMTKVAEEYVREIGQKGPIKCECDGRMHEAKGD